MKIALRDVTEDDLPIFFQFQLDPEANRMAAFTSKDPMDQAAFMAHWKKIMQDGNSVNRTIELDGQVVGSVLRFDFFEQPNVAYWIGKEYWGRGIATAALTDFVKQEKTRPLYGRAAKDNLASIRVLEKCGFVLIGKDKGYANARGTEIEEVILKLE